MPAVLQFFWSNFIRASPIVLHIHDLTDKEGVTVAVCVCVCACVCVCVCVCVCFKIKSVNNVYMGKTSPSNDVHSCICTLAMGKTSPRTLSALETNASAPILLTAARADLVTTF